MEEQVSASTQNQALAALLFLYRDLLERDLELEGVIRARTRQRIPVVLSEAEYNRLRRLADRPAAAGQNCLDWLLDLPPAQQGRSKAEIDAELGQERDW